MQDCSANFEPGAVKYLKQTSGQRLETAGLFLDIDSPASVLWGLALTQMPIVLKISIDGRPDVR
jgi:hypothetical protein